MLRVQELARLHGLFLVLVAIERRDALLGRAVLLVGKTRFLERVELAVPGQQQRRAVADLQILRRDDNARGAQRLHLLEQVFAVQRHAVAQDVDNAVAENAARQQVQGKLALFIHHSVARVAAALIADDHVIMVREVVDHAALAFIAPVDTYDRAICHCIDPPIRSGPALRVLLKFFNRVIIVTFFAHEKS